MLSPGATILGATDARRPRVEGCRDRRVGEWRPTGRPVPGGGTAPIPLAGGRAQRIRSTSRRGMRLGSASRRTRSAHPMRHVPARSGTHTSCNGPRSRSASAPDRTPIPVRLSGAAQLAATDSYDCLSRFPGDGQGIGACSPRLGTKVLDWPKRSTPAGGGSLEPCGETASPWLRSVSRADGG